MSDHAPIPAEVAALGGRLAAAVGATWQGSPAVLSTAITALLSGGHLLLEDVPGVGKTTLATSLAAAIGATFRRIQATADLLPGDLTGVLVLDPETRALTFRPGPLFAQIVLVDEVNRMPPRTQSALLEAMAEGVVSVDGTPHPLPAPFLVLATQNPFDHHGTWPLPESQLDRFAMRLHLGYPRREAERALLRRAGPARLPAPVCTPDALAAAQRAVDAVQVAGPVEDWILDLVAASRVDGRLLRGISPRGALALHRLARARALVDGRAWVVPEDVTAVAVPALAHRVVPRALDGADAAIRELLREVAPPR